jgi:hypothetical protein
MSVTTKVIQKSKKNTIEPNSVPSIAAPGPSQVSILTIHVFLDVTGDLARVARARSCEVGGMTENELVPI